MKVGIKKQYRVGVIGSYIVRSEMSSYIVQTQN